MKWMYHGSPHYMEGPTPQDNPLCRRPVVFGSDQHGIALLFISRDWGDEDLSLGSVVSNGVQGPMTLTELRQGALNKAFHGKGGWLYRLEPHSFQDLPHLMQGEFVSFETPPVLFFEYIEDLLEHIMCSNLVIVPFQS